MSAWTMYTTSGPRHRRRGRWLVAIAVAAIFGALISGSSHTRPATRTPAPTTGASPRTAVIAALTYLDALSWDVVVDDKRRFETISAFATEDVATELNAELAAPAENLRAATSEGPVVARSAVLGYRIDDFSRERATVSIWGVALLATGVYPPATQWSTSRIALAWSSDRWRVTNVDSRGGPSPDSDLPDLAEATRSFRELNDAP